MYGQAYGTCLIVDAVPDLTGVLRSFRVQMMVKVTESELFVPGLLTTSVAVPDWAMSDAGMAASDAKNPRRWWRAQVHSTEVPLREQSWIQY